MLGVFLSNSQPYFWGLNLEFTDSTRLADQCIPGVHLPPRPQWWSDRHTCLLPAFTWVLVSALRSSYISCNPFTHQAPKSYLQSTPLDTRLHDISLPRIPGTAGANQHQRHGCCLHSGDSHHAWYSGKG